MKSWLFGPFLEGRAGRTALSSPPGARRDSCLSRELRRNTLRIPSWKGIPGHLLPGGGSPDTPQVSPPPRHLCRKNRNTPFLGLAENETPCLSVGEVGADTNTRG